MDDDGVVLAVLKIAPPRRPLLMAEAVMDEMVAITRKE